MQVHVISCNNRGNTRGNVKVNITYFPQNHVIIISHKYMPIFLAPFSFHIDMLFSVQNCPCYFTLTKAKANI